MNKRVLTVQDISCVGQCSLTVALPVLSACGVEAAVLPSAVLSTHTGGGFAGYTFRDLTADMPAIAQHWQKEGFRFDAVYTGYLGSGEQITHVRHIMDTLLVPGGARIVDPAMADNGKLYAGFDAAFVEKMKTLAFSADILLPNITEAALLTGMEYRKEYDEAYIEELTAALHEKGVGTVVLTGVSYEPETTGVVVTGRRALRGLATARAISSPRRSRDFCAAGMNRSRRRRPRRSSSSRASGAPNRSTGTACGLSRCSIRSRRRPRGLIFRTRRSIFRNDLAARQSA